MERAEIDRLIEIAEKSAMQAGQFLIKNRNLINIINSSEGRDIKLAADLESEKLILDFLIQNSNYPILAEESGKSEKLGDTFWVVDPLDGTANFSRNIPISCVSIALVQKFEPVLGVIYDFNNYDLYSGSLNTKASLNGNLIMVSSEIHKEQAVLITGLPINTNYSNKSMKALIDDFKKWKKIRMFGSAAMAAAFVSSAKADAYKESGTNLWDVAAGVAIVRAAGGKAIISNMSDDFSLDIYMSNGKIN